MKNEEIAERLLKIIGHAQPWPLAKTMEAMTDLYKDLTEPVREVPQEGPYLLAALLNSLTATKNGKPITICVFANADPATRRMMEKAYAGYAWLLKYTQGRLDKGDLGVANQIVNYIETGVTDESP